MNPTLLRMAISGRILPESNRVSAFQNAVLEVTWPVTRVIHDLLEVLFAELNGNAGAARRRDASAQRAGPARRTGSPVCFDGARRRSAYVGPDSARPGTPALPARQTRALSQFVSVGLRPGEERDRSVLRPRRREGLSGPGFLR